MNNDGKRKHENTSGEPDKSFKKKKRYHKKSAKNRRGRIIIRNLPFKTTEENLKQHFEKYGVIDEINILKQSDGKLVGCGFIQFKVVQNAAKAIYHENGKPFLGRTIVCDWALGKNTYVNNVMVAQTEIKKEEPDENNTENTNEPLEIKEDDISNIEIKEEVLSDNEDEKINITIEDKGDDNNSNSENSDEDDEDEESNDSDIEVESIKEENKPRVLSNDINEGKTVFIKNVPFTATNEDLKECLMQFGPIYYALICIDPVTEHSKGTAFAKFVNLEDAEKCLSAGTELMLMENILDCHKAISKNELQNRSANKTKIKDSRNLYLIKEGVILAGSKAAEGVSASDMAKRLELERWKSQMLRNLNMFISRYRLIIHNLPESFDDNRLKKLFIKYTGPNSVIKECRVMRDMRNLDNKGRGTSKEYAFVSFEHHEDALKALRAINNNPSIFVPHKRPIVAFSIENKAIINARNKRLEKSKLNNPTYNKHNVESKAQKKKTKNTSQTPRVLDDSFVGMVAKTGVNKMRSRYKLKTQAQIHMQQMKKAKKQKKFEKKSLEQKKKQFIRQSAQKQKPTKKKKDDSDNFSQLVNKYKSKISDQNIKKKNKWYES